MTHRAIIWVPAREAERWQRACLEDCETNGEEIVAIVMAKDGRRWEDAEAMLDSGEADVIVVGRWDHVPRQAAPRVRVAAESQLPGQRRRPRVIG